MANDRSDKQLRERKSCNRVTDQKSKQIKTETTLLTVGSTYVAQDLYLPPKARLKNLFKA